MERRNGKVLPFVVTVLRAAGGNCAVKSRCVISGAGVGELPVAVGAGEVGGDGLPEGWRREVGRGEHNVRGVGWADKGESEGAILLAGRAVDER